jgi:hypothetical protein
MEKKNSAEILKVAWIKVGNSSYGLQEDPLGIYYRDITVIDNDILEDINLVKDIDFFKDIDNILYSLNYKFIVKLLKYYPKEKELLKNKRIDYIIVQDDTVEEDEEEISNNQDSEKDVVKHEEKHSIEILKVAWIENSFSSSCCLIEDPLGIYPSVVTIIDNDILKNIERLEDIILSEDIDSIVDVHDRYVKLEEKSIVELLKHYPKEKELLRNKKIDYIVVEKDVIY